MTPQTPYITREGHELMQQEYHQLRYKRRPLVTKALSEAAAEGDRSENAEYIYRKKELREIDRRIRYLQKRLPDLKVVYDKPTDQSKIFFGAWIEVDGPQGVRIFRIVGKDEVDSKGTQISIDSPVARALLKKEAGEEVLVRTPQGEVWYEVLAVSYTPILRSEE